MRASWLWCLLTWGMLTGTAAAQQLTTRWYDDEHTHLKSRFFVAPDGQLWGSYEQYYSHGLLMVKGQYERGVATGTWTWYHENGKPRMRGLLRANQPVGHWQYFDKEGRLEQEGNWEAGRKVGEWRFYHPNGTLSERGVFAGETRIGVWRGYDAEGNLLNERTYQGDVARYVGYYPSGEVRAEGWLHHEASDSLWRYYHENGHLQAIGEEANGQRVGPWRFFHPNDTLAAEGGYRQGAKDGTWVYYHEDGSVSARGTEQAGLKEGAWEMLYPSGKFKAQLHFNNGNGPYEEYYENGMLKMRGQMQEGVPAGAWEFFNENGWQEGKAQYEQGQGHYVGFYPDGKLKTEGAMEGFERVGEWTFYTPEGLLAGYYQAYQTPSIEATLAVRDSLGPVDKPDLILRRRRLRYFRPRVNELRTVIVSTNPLATAFGQLPLSIEYYLENRLGYELGINWLRNPFFYKPSDAYLNRPFRTGYAVELRQKLYHPGGLLDVWYWGQELQYVNRTHQAFVRDSVGQLSSPRLLAAREKRYALSFLMGARQFWRWEGAHLALDFYGGVGIGYRTIERDWEIENPEWRSVFKRQLNSRVIVPVRVGVTAGYFF
ncbi:Antitoxin component YwqK of the YwqJK toxin-antitoxin module [Catalinimonas alkaloidigena]|uniref:Antitoxin component YwqK of the YwqJK toxin-antitoxin module n=2 Tax=Catalinimonas alkaloidigena TaxID=1075417 RepID=A0A1G9KV97_9BACT|nr:Antitoxin component YwqK of the YwqJK toxin-antitoxin module [Catalinimonas alkaloidigena]